MRTHEVKKEMGMIWESYVMGEPVKEEDHRGHGHDCEKVHPDQSHDEWKMSKETKKMNEGEHWSQMPAAQALASMEKAIEDLEPAGDVQELYKDALEAHIDAKVLNTIVDKAIDSGALSTQEAHFITSGAVGENDPSDVGHRGFDKPKQEGLDDEERDRLTNLGPVNDVPYEHPDEGQYDKAKQFIDWLTSSHNQAAKKYRAAFNDPDVDGMDLGREIYGNMSPELQREYDQDVLIDAIEDKIGEAGMRPKEGNVQPFSQYFNEDGDGQQRVMDQFIAAINEVDADSSIMDIQDLAQELISVHKADPRELEQHIRRAKVSFEEDEIQYVLTGKEI